MKLKENDKIPNSEFFIMENGSPVKKDTLEFFKDKRIVLFGLQALILRFVQLNIYLAMLIIMKNIR